MVIQALLLGLSTGLYCATACFPLLLSALFTRGAGPWKSPAAGIGQFLAGRLVAYALVGAVAGLAGRFMGGFQGIPSMLVSVVYMATGILMATQGLVESFPHARACAAMSRGLRNPAYMLFLGFLTGVNICPPFVLAFSAAVGLGGVARSVVFFLVFFCATSIYMAPFLFSGFASRMAAVRKAARIVSVAVGGYFALVGGQRILVEIVEHFAR
jgi:hypothetical protein